MLHFLLHVTGGDNGSGPFYLELSGFVALLGFVGAAWTYLKHARCHVDGCNKRGKYPFQHYKLCRLHHPAVPEHITHAHIKVLHKHELIDHIKRDKIG